MNMIVYNNSYLKYDYVLLFIVNRFVTMNESQA